MRISSKWQEANAAGTLSRITSLRKGARFTCIQGAHWTYDHEHHGCVYVRDAAGDEDCFAACASVLEGWV